MLQKGPVSSAIPEVSESFKGLKIIKVIDLYSSIQFKVKSAVCTL